MTAHAPSLELPGATLDVSRMPGHWLLARLGKRVLRPGGRELTAKMLEALGIAPSDHLVELAPGLGATTRVALAAGPASYVGIERDEAAARLVRRVLRDGRDEVRQGIASKTGLDDGHATVLFGEAMLTMHTDEQKRAIVREACRVLRAGGRYGIHELALTPDDLSTDERAEVERALSGAIHVGARPLTVADWRALLEAEGLDVVASETAPMLLLEPGRLVADEGLLGAVRVCVNTLRSSAARRRVLEMRGVFRQYASKMCAVMLVAKKRGDLEPRAARP